jgi:hypothetical protein
MGDKNTPWKENTLEDMRRDIGLENEIRDILVGGGDYMSQVELAQNSRLDSVAEN